MSNLKWAKRIMAIALALSMMLTMLGGYVPGWFTAFAEDEAQTEVQTKEDSASDSEEGEPTDQEEADETPSEEKPAEAPVEEEVEEPAGAPVEEEAEEPAGAPVEEEAEKPAGAPVEEEAEESAEAPVEEEVEESAEAPVEEEVEESAEAPVEEEAEESAEAPVEEEAEESAEAPIEEEAEEPAEAPVEEEVEESFGAPVEEKAEDSAGTPVEEVIEEPEEDQTIPATALPGRFTLTMAAPASAAVQQTDEGSNDADETIEITEPALEVSNVAAAMAVPRENAVLTAAAPAEQASASAANEETTDETASPQAAEGTVALQQLVKDRIAALEQSGGLLNSDLISGIVNPVNVKIGTAEVNIATGAQLAAGYGVSGNSAPSGSGSITAEAKVSTDMSAGDGKLSLPVAVNVAVQNASVEVAKDAVLKAAGNINISAESRIESKAEAPSQAAGKDVPFAASVNVILNNAAADVNGKLTAGGDVAVSALGDMTSEATAKHEGDGLSGLFVGVNVPLQNVRALLGEGTVVNAGGAVSVKSTANQKATTVAWFGSAPAEASNKGDSYAAEKEDSGLDKTKDIGFGMVKEYIGGPLGSLWGKIKDKVGGLFKDAPTESEKLDSMMGWWECSCKVNTLHPPGADNMSLAMPSVTPVPTKSGNAASAGGSSGGSSRRSKACPTR